VCKGGHVEKSLDELWGHTDSQPQEHTQTIGQKEGPSFGETFLRAADGSWDSITLQIQAVLWGGNTQEL